MTFHQFVLNDSTLTLGEPLLEQIINIMHSQCSDDSECQFLKRMMYQVSADEDAEKTNGGHFYSLHMYNDTIAAAAYYHPTLKHTASIQFNDHTENCSAEPKQWAVVWSHKLSPGYKTSWNC